MSYMQFCLIIGFGQQPVKTRPQIALPPTAEGSALFPITAHNESDFMHVLHQRPPLFKVRKAYNLLNLIVSPSV
jgi:hypothetical protein